MVLEKIEAARVARLAIAVASAMGAVTLVHGEPPVPLPGSEAASPLGPFTRDQADRGRALYEQTCAACHGAALAGGSAPALAGDAFHRS